MMNKKKVLFIIGTLQSGGVSKSIVNLLNVIDRHKYDVHLQIMSKSGAVYDKYLPSDITVHYDKKTEAIHNGLGGLAWLLRHYYIAEVLMSITRMIISRFNKSWSGILLAKMTPPLEEVFDLIVDYGGQQQLYYMVDKLKGKKRITFVHNDYRKWSYYYTADKKYYPRVDAIFTISEECVKAMKEVFPNCSDKVHLMENITSPQLIYELSQETIDDFPEGNVFVSIGHINEQKGTDIAIDTVKLLKQREIDFKWIFIGKVIRQDWVNRVYKEGLQDKIQFMGIKSNPYPYMRKSTLIVHTARFEGKSIALDEAKLLCRPIVVTNFSTVNDQFENGINASICEMNGKSIADTIQALLENKNLQQTYIDNLKNQIRDNSSEINKIYKLLEE